jgi:type IV secretory pathway TrbD component
MSSGDQGRVRGRAAEEVNRDGLTENMLPEREVHFAPTVHHVHRRPFGLSPAPLLAGLAAGLIVIALLLIVLGSWIAGIVFLVLSGVAVSLLAIAARREPDEQASRLALNVAGSAGGWARLTAVALRASARAGLELARVWVLRRRLRFALRRQLTPLGEAVHRGDQARVEQLKARADELSRALQETDRRASEAIAALRNQLGREHAVSHRTQRLPVVDETTERGG